MPAALCILGSVLLLTWDWTPGAPGVVGVIHRLSAASLIGSNGVAFGTHWVLAFPLGLAWFALRAREIVRRWWVVAIAAVAAYVALLASGAPKAGIALAAALGFAVLWDILADAWARRDGTQAILGAWLLVPLVALPYSHLPAKLNLAAAPAAAILLARLLAASRPWPSRAVVAVATSAGVALGGAILSADAAFAGLARRAVTELVEPHTRAGARVWFTPHWGFQWYAERAGAMPLSIEPPFPVPGDLVVNSRNTAKGAIAARFLLETYDLAPIARIEDAAFGGRVMTEGAGFFSSRTGYLPWTWGREPLDSISLWRIESYKRFPGRAP